MFLDSRREGKRFRAEWQQALAEFNLQLIHKGTNSTFPKWKNELDNGRSLLSGNVPIDREKHPKSSKRTDGLPAGIRSGRPPISGEDNVLWE
jgi:hypothetical protein